MIIVGLHGYWGSPSDFDRFQTAVGDVTFWFPDLFLEGHLDPSHSFGDWTKNFLHELKTRFGDQAIQLVGYSQGARLALHALLQEPARFEHAWLLSAHPGQLSEQAKRERADWIAVWKQKVMEEDWDHLIRDWNNQEVFAGSGHGAKPKVSRALLAQALENWSLLKHRFTWKELREFKAPTTWVFGALDRKFLNVKEDLQKQDVAGDFWIVAGAGHRLLVDAPEILAQGLKERTNYV